MLFTLAVAVLVLLAQGVAAQNVLQVHVYNDSHAAEPLVRASMLEAGRILARAGVKSVWRLCGEWKELRCTPTGASNEFAFTVTGVERDDISRRALGFALPFTPRADHAAAILPRIEDFVRGQGWAVLRDVLAAVMAHEIGHLLLRSNEHGHGIMQARWDPAQVRQMAKARLSFTPTQAEALQAGVREWSELLVAGNAWRR